MFRQDTANFMRFILGLFPQMCVSCALHTIYLFPRLITYILIRFRQDAFVFVWFLLSKLKVQCMLSKSIQLRMLILDWASTH